MDKIINLLKQYKQVFLYRHINPDYDDIRILVYIVIIRINMTI